MKPAKYTLRHKLQKKASDKSYRCISNDIAYLASEGVYDNMLDEVAWSLWHEVWQKYS